LSARGITLSGAGARGKMVPGTSPAAGDERESEGMNRARSRRSEAGTYASD